MWFGEEKLCESAGKLHYANVESWQRGTFHPRREIRSKKQLMNFTRCNRPTLWNFRWNNRKALYNRQQLDMQTGKKHLMSRTKKIPSATANAKTPMRVQSARWILQRWCSYAVLNQDDINSTTTEAKIRPNISTALQRYHKETCDVSVWPTYIKRTQDTGVDPVRWSWAILPGDISALINIQS